MDNGQKQRRWSDHDIVGFSLQLLGYNGNPCSFMYFYFLQQVWDSSLPLGCKPTIMIESYCCNQSYKNFRLIFYIMVCLKFLMHYCIYLSTPTIRSQQSQDWLTIITSHYHWWWRRWRFNTFWLTPKGYDYTNYHVICAMSQIYLFFKSYHL